MTTGEIIKKLRIEKGLSQEELGAMVGVQRAAINKYEKGLVVNLKRPVIEKLAYSLGVSPTVIMGFSEEGNKPETALATNLEQIELDRVPLVGRIACGQPILAEEHIEDYVDMPRHINADFALECHGDSMVGAGIQDGDIVYIRKQPVVENGQIAAVVIDGDEATLKRFYQDANKVILSAENPAYAPFIYVDDEINNIRIVGRAVGFTHKL